MYSQIIALREALRYDLPRLANRQIELENALNNFAKELKDDPLSVGFKLAANFPELRGLMPLLSSVHTVSVDELYQLAHKLKVTDGIVQASADIIGRFMQESPLLLVALHRIFPLRVDAQAATDDSAEGTRDYKASATANLRKILAAGLWVYAGKATGQGSYTEAINALEQTIEFAHQADDWLLEAWALWKIALIDPQLGTPKGFTEFQKTSSEYLIRAQGYYLSALHILDTTPAAQGNRDADHLKTRLLLLLCATTLFDNPKQTLEYANRAHALGVHLNKKDDIFEALMIAGTALTMLNVPKNAVFLLLRARSIAAELNDSQLMSRCLMPLANALVMLNYLPLASVVMTAAILIEDKKILEDLSRSEGDALKQFRESAHRIEQDGKREEFLLAVSSSINSMANKLSQAYEVVQESPKKP